MVLLACVQAAVRRPQVCGLTIACLDASPQTRHSSPTRVRIGGTRETRRLPRLAVLAQPPTATDHRRDESSASVPPPRRAASASPSEVPSITPSTDAGALSVLARKLGNSAAGTSCPRSASRLAVAIPATLGRQPPLITFGLKSAARPRPSSASLSATSNPRQLASRGPLGANSERSPQANVRSVSRMPQIEEVIWRSRPGSAPETGRSRSSPAGDRSLLVDLFLQLARAR